MWTMLQSGGVMLWVILGCGLVALVVTLERAFHLHRARIRTEDFLKGVYTILRQHSAEEALAICEETPGPVASLVRAAILHREAGREALGRAIDEAALTELARMERRLTVLATMAQVAPVMGLLGTVLGLIEALLAVQRGAPLVQAGDLAGGLWQALLTTAAGLVVGIFGALAYNVLLAKVDAIALDMERSAGDVQGFLAGSGSLLAAGGPEA